MFYAYPFHVKFDLESPVACELVFCGNVFYDYLGGPPPVIFMEVLEFRVPANVFIGEVVSKMLVADCIFV